MSQIIRHHQMPESRDLAAMDLDDDFGDGTKPDTSHIWPERLVYAMLIGAIVCFAFGWTA